jgi:hypothetical protein
MHLENTLSKAHEFNRDQNLHSGKDKNCLGQPGQPGQPGTAFVCLELPAICCLEETTLPATT